MKRSTESPEKKILLRPEQKSAELIIDLVSEPSKEEELVLDTCAGTAATARGCYSYLSTTDLLDVRSTQCVSRIRFVAGGRLRKNRF